MSDTRHLMKNAGTVGLATLASRILGFVRDVLIAGYFGAGLFSDAFFTAFRIPNLFRRLFAEGSLSMAFVSVFTEYLVTGGRKEAYAFAGTTLKIVSLILVAVSVAGIGISPWLIKVLAPGFSAIPHKFEITVLMNRIMFPYLFFIGLVAVCMGILNVLGHFAAPALAPVLLNLSMIGAMLFISPHLETPVFGLCWGVVAGGVLQLGLQIPVVIRKGIRLKNTPLIFHPGIGKIGRLMLPMAFGAAAYQINMLVGTFLASFLAQGSISYLYYADRMVQLPLGLFAVATATAALPVLARQAARQDMAAVRKTFAGALNGVLFVAVPAMVGLVLLRRPIISLLFERGAFGTVAAGYTADALLCYGMGIWAFSGVRVLISTYYALQDTQTPVKIALVSMAVNITAAAALMIPMGHAGIALAASVSSAVNFCLLLKYLSRKVGGLDTGNLLASAGKTAISSAVMGIAVYGLALFWGTRPLPPVKAGLALFSSIGCGILIYGTCSAVLKHPEFYGMLAQLRYKK